MVSRYTCANWDPEHADCKEEGRYSCKNCRLVTYCGPACQKSHWPDHKPECRSPLGQETWQPAWVQEGRTPAFIGDGPQGFGGSKYFWGNVPAIDILQLESNEGKDYSGDLRLLFAASGDLRNVIKTVAGLPSTYNHPLDITINDRDPDIVVRNVILLLIAFTVENVDKAVDCILHVWYSALVRESDIEILQRHIRPLIEDVCEKIKHKKPGGLFGKTWTFGQCALRVVLEKPSWIRLLSFVKPVDLSVEQARRVRATTTLSESRKDFRDRYRYCLPPVRRIAFTKFSHDGLLLPFGHPRDEFRKPNPTFFQNIDTWPMKDDANPLEGWPMAEVEDTASGPASADIYGKLFYYVREMLRSFLDRLRSLKISFRLFQVDVSSLPDHVEKDSLSRIEVSNISDAGWLGIHLTLGLMVPLLQAPLQNPHATLVTLFMNAVEETLTEEDKIRDMHRDSSVSKRLREYLPLKRMPTSPYDPAMVKLLVGIELVKNYDHIIDRYLEGLQVSEIAGFLGTKAKEKHTIIEKWPYRLKLQPGQPGAQDEFDRLLRSGVSGKERYLEWKRVHPSMV
ncbi:hypothetical protein FQN54_004657 [Arachnomyces sp. PD_36]|nr:hypothetical protein FQN54_004657 [Arachnomyces sp. PD_36]